MIGSDGEKIGTVEELYVDTDSQQPEWMSVSTGFFGTHRSLVPLAEASEEGDEVLVPYAKEQVKDAAHYDPARELSDQDEADLFRHYGTAEATDGSGTPESGERSTLAGAPGTQGRDVSGQSRQ